MNNRSVPLRLCLAMAFDTEFSDIGEPCLAALRAYGIRHSLPVEFERPHMNARPPSWAKIDMIRRLFDQGYDAVAWIDADAFVQPGAEDIRGLFNEAELLIATHDLNGRQTPNCGVMLIRNTPWSRRLLDRLDECRHYTNHFWWENAALLEILGHTEFSAEGVFPRGWIFRVERRFIRTFGMAPALVRSLVRRTQTRLRARIGRLPDRWNWIPTNACCAQDAAIIHLAGMPFSSKREWIRLLTQNNSATTP